LVAVSDVGMPADLLARCDCVAATWTPQQRLHPGDVAWAGAGGDGGAAPDTTVSWGDPLVAFADVWQAESITSTAYASLHVSPRASSVRRSLAVREILDMAPTVVLDVSRGDVHLVAALAGAGFRDVSSGPWFARLWRELADLGDLARYVLPPGFTVVPVDPVDGERVRNRVEVHRRAWSPARIKALLGLPVTGEEPGSRYSVAVHEAVMAAPGYRPGLDLMAVAPDGTVAAYALGWFDDRNRSVLFEPVGTDPRFAGRGLACAVCAELLRRARELGARQAVVGPRGDAGYPLPLRVYQALGMCEVARVVPMSRDAESQ
jgi:ribosomal protein S18 acetylase RimI-like enzyme